MSTYSAIAIAVPFLFSPLFGQVDRDTSVFVFPEVIVHGSALAEAASRSATFEKEVPSHSLRHLVGMPVDRVLRRSGLVYVRDRGGRSSVTTIGLRGHAATHTTITLNGFSLTNEQNGIVDMGLYPLDIIGGISVLRGSQSSFSGSGGIAGAVRLRTERGNDRTAGLRGGVGSYGYRSAAVRFPLDPIGLPVAVRAGIISDDGSFPYDVSQAGIRTSGRREGNTSRLLYSLLESRHTLAPSSMLTTFVYVADATRGSPGAVPSQVPSDATLYDRMARGAARLVYSAGGILWEGELSGLYHWQRYQDRSTLLPLNDRYTNRGLSGSLRSIVAMGDDISLTAGTDLGRHDIDATMVSFPEGSTRGALYASLAYTGVSSSTAVYPSARVDLFSELQPILSWKVAVHQMVLDGGLLVLRMGVGTGFRMPSFNERYWIVGGNPDLRHERSVMFEGGISSRFSTIGTHDILVLAHWSEATDKIVGWPPTNAERSRMVGGEATWSWSPHDAVALTAGAAFADVESLEPHQPGKQFPYIPRLTTSASVTAGFSGFELSAAMEYASRRYTTIDNLKALSSEPYAVTTLSCTAPVSSAGFEAHVTCLVDNVFDETYEIVKGYPMPGRSVTLSVSMEFM